MKRRSKLSDQKLTAQEEAAWYIAGLSADGCDVDQYLEEAIIKYGRELLAQAKKDHIGEPTEMVSAVDKVNEWVTDNYPDIEILLPVGFAEAFIGVATQFDRVMAVYDRQKCIEILMRDMSEEDAYEYFEFNVTGAYVGENTPAFIEIIKE
jgi:hypothetical protein